MWLGLAFLDWLVLACYLVSVTVLGVMAHKKVSDMTDFFMGGRRFGKVFMMFFAFGAGTSSEQANSVVAGTWRVGLAGIWWQFLWLWATPFYWIVAPIMRRMRALTTSDFFEARFDKSTAILYSIWGMIMAIVMIAGALFGSGKMIDALTGGQLTTVADEQFKDHSFIPVFDWDAEKSVLTTGSRPIKGYEIAILAITVLFVTYGMAGGLGAAIWTDFIQGVLTIMFSILLLPFVFAKIGGFAMLNPEGVEPIKRGMFEMVASEEVAALLGREPITIFYVLMLSFTALAGIVVQPHIMGVCGAGKTEFEGRFGFTFGNFIKRFCTIAWTFTALACIVWYLGESSPLRTSDDPEDKATLRKIELVNSQSHAEEFEALSKEEKTEIKEFERDFADRLFGRAAYDILPDIGPGLVGLLLASLLAAMMSTCDAQMIVGSGLFTENIYRRYLRRDKSVRHYLWVGRISGLVIVILALWLQTTFTDVIDALKVVIKTPAVIGISLWIGICWRGWTPAAVWVSSIVASAVWALCSMWPSVIADAGFLDFTLRETAKGTVVSDAWTMTFYMTAGIGTGVLTSLFTRRPPPEKLDQFFRLMRTPITPGEVISEPCTLPENPAAPIDKMFDHPDIEIPKPTRLDVFGFLAAWVMVGLIIGLVWWLAR